MRQWLICNSQMLSLHSLFNQNHRLPLLATMKCSDVFLRTRRKAHPFPSSSSSRCCTVCSNKTDSPQFEVDPDKARQALQELDEQLQSFSKKQVNPPKNKAQDMNNIPRRNEMRGGEITEISETLLTNSAVILFIFSIFYNVLFYAVIKPSIDVPLPTPTSITSDSQSQPPLFLQQLLPLSSSFFISPSLLT